jgi:hypothetical protein
MNLARVLFWNLGSGNTSRLAATLLLGIFNSLFIQGVRYKHRASSEETGLTITFRRAIFSYLKTDTMQEKAGTKRAGLIEVLNLAV